MSAPIRIAEESRFARFSLISWWEQPRLEAARMLVVGAGALGNEVLKNLALLGVGHVAIVDMDRIEISNLSRAVLFREADCGRLKVHAAVDAIRGLYPGMEARPVRADVTWEAGLGLFRWADVVIGALDSREARLAINRFCSLTGRIWIDGGIDVLSGIARVFPPGDGACYECTLSDEDWRLVEQRRACSLLPRDDAEPRRRVPTTPTTASVIAGVQCAEAIKIVHGLGSLKSEGFVFDGQSYESYRVRYPRDPQCYGHEALPPVEELAATSDRLTVGALIEEFRLRLGRNAQVEACRELVAAVRCEPCGTEERRGAPLEALRAPDVLCVTCGEPGAPVVYRRLDVAPCDPSATLEQIGLPRWDIVVGRSGPRAVALAIGGDAAALFGEDTR